MKKQFITLPVCLAVLAVTGCANDMRGERMAMQPTPTPMHDMFVKTLPTLARDAQYRHVLSGPATVSLMASQIAVEKAKDPKVREFAQFELDEQQTADEVMTRLHTKKMSLNADQKALLDHLNSVPAGPKFDHDYMAAQLDTHMILRDITTDFLDNSNDRTMPEMAGRNLAMVMLSTIKQHIVQARMILDKHMK